MSTQDEAPSHTADEFQSTLGRMLPIADVCHETGLSRATIYRRISTGTFPAPTRLGSRTVRWCEADIETWKRSQITPHENLVGA